MRGAARSPRATKPASRFSTTIARRCSTSPLYHADGQQRDEVYNWGSFLQSKMYASGVTCSDCHDPHSGKLRAEGNALCAACHLPSKYDAAAHHHHKPGSAGAACVACHMPTTTYMVVDPRHDHSLRVPRPDLSVKFGHAERLQRLSHQSRRALGGGAGEAMVRPRAAGLSTLRRGVCRCQRRRARCAGATARDRRRRQPSGHRARHGVCATQCCATVKPHSTRLPRARAIRSPLVRLAALQSLAGALAGCARSVGRAAPRRSAESGAHRSGEPARARAGGATELRSSAPSFERASAEYIASQRYNADRADARVNLGTFYANRGDAAKAEEEIKAAIRLDPHFIPAYVNLG